MARFAGPVVLLCVSLGPLGGCQSLPGPFGRGGAGDHLVDYHEFDPAAGVLWADSKQRSEADLKKAHPIFLIDVTVVDGTGAAPKPHMDVLIDKGRIAEMGPTGDIIPPKGTEKIKAPGATAMPGLVDVLAFASTGGGPLWEPGTVDERRVLESNLYAGVTTLVAGGDAEKLAELRDAIKKGEILGPQLFLAAPVVTVRKGYPSELADTGMLGKLAGGAGGWAREILNPADAKAKINELADNKAKFDVIPIVYDTTPAAFPKISEDSLRVCIDRIHTRGRKSFVFTGTLEDVITSLRHGADAVLHGVYEEPLDDEKAAKLAQIVLAENRGYAPALVELWGKGYSIAGQSWPAIPLEKETTDSETLSAFTIVPKKREGMLYKYVQSVGPQVPVAAANLGKLAAWRSEGGETMPVLAASTAAGPGLFPGAALHRELGLMVKAGVPAVQAIAGATSRAAALVREDKADFGILAPGKRADVLLVDGDVAADIDNTQHIRTVIVGGRIVDRVPLGKWEERLKAKAAPAPRKDDRAPEGGKDKKRKRSTGADEDPTPMNEP